MEKPLLKTQHSKLEYRCLYPKVEDQAIRPVFCWSNETSQRKVVFGVTGLHSGAFLHLNLERNDSFSHSFDIYNIILKGYEDCGGQVPMFQTGSGKSVLISESSVQKARAVLEEEHNINKGIMAYQTVPRLFH